MKPYLLPENPSAAMAGCIDPELLPDWMEDVTLPQDLSEWQKENLRNIARNGRGWSICRDRYAELVRWIQELPVP